MRRCAHRYFTERPRGAESFKLRLREDLRQKVGILCENERVGVYLVSFSTPKAISGLIRRIFLSCVQNVLTCAI